ncbi:MAG: hypothetical protein GXP62_14365, partial [Oligoflexia bacterium]|nr:hypothetical protein [Oligoflexia bacterium]
MDTSAWMEQVEAALDSDNKGLLKMLISLDPRETTPELALVRCRLRAALGDAGQAAQAFPDFAEIEDKPELHRGWVATAVDLALRGAIPNHWGLGRALRSMAEQAVGRGDTATALDILERHVHAALDRDAHEVALRGVELAARVMVPSSKRRMKAAAAALDALAAAVAEHVPTDPELPDPTDLAGPDMAVDVLLASLGANPERDLDRLVAAIDRWPGRADLIHSATRCWQALDDDAAGTELFARAVAARPQDLDLATAFGWHLVRQRDLPTLEAFVEQRFLGDCGPADREPAAQARLLARARLDRAATGAALTSVDRMLALDPKSVPGRHLRAQILRAEDQQEAALDLLDELAREVDEAGQRSPAAQPWHWDRMELGTALHRWRSVRDSALRLGMPVEAGGEAGGEASNEPIDERWSPCRILLPWAEAGDTEHDAMRTGPVTARLLTLAPPGRRQRYGDVVIFRAEALDEGGSPGARDHAGPLFRAVQVLSRGDVVVRDLAGRPPGDQTLDAFAERLHALGVALSWWELSEPDARGHTLLARIGLPE